MKEDKLHNINNPGFKAPKDYFESFDQKLMQRLNDEKSIEGVSTTGFKAPDGYFDTLETDILNKIKAEKPKKVISLFSRKKWYYVSGIAASLLLLVAVFIKQDETVAFSEDIVVEYFADSDLDSYDLAELLVSAEIIDEDFSLEKTNYSEENLENYLLDNVDIESIIE